MDGVADGGEGPDTGAPNITPPSATIAAGRWLQLTADQPVSWSIQEAAGGSIDRFGSYHAPVTLGDVHVVARNARNESATAVITVRAPRLDFVAGQLDYEGNADGVGPRAYFSGLLTIAYDKYLSSVLVVTHTDTELVRRVLPGDGTVSTLLGVRGDARVLDGGNGTTPRIGLGSALADYQDGVLVADGNALRLGEHPEGSPNLQTLVGVADQPGFVNGGLSVARFNGISSIAVVGNTAYIVDYGNCAIRVVDLGSPSYTVSTLAGGTCSGVDTDGTGTDARFLQPVKIVFDGKQTLYVSEWERGVLRSVDVTTGEVTTVQPVTYTEGPLALDGQGHLYYGAADRIQMIDLTTGAVSTFCGGTPRFDAETVLVDGACSQAGFNYVWDLAFDGNGSLYVGDYAALRKIDLLTATVTTIAGSGNCKIPACNIGPLLPAPGGITFADPQTVLTTTGGVDYGSDLTRVDLASGMEMTTNIGAADHPRGVARAANGVVYAGGLGSVLVYDPATNRTSTTAGESDLDPEGLALDAQGALLIANGTRGNIVRVTLTLSADVLVRPVVSSLQEIASGFNHPLGIAVDASGNLFVTDNDAVYQIPAGGGSSSQLAGLPGVRGYADGAAATARFSGANGLALDAHGSLYIADSDNGLIRRLDLTTGMVSTELGIANLRGVKWGALPASLNRPRSVAVSSNGDLALTDEDAVLWLH
jgi:sugar lactone lactonase YvrE